MSLLKKTRRETYGRGDEVGLPRDLVSGDKKGDKNIGYLLTIFLKGLETGIIKTDQFYKKNSTMNRHIFVMSKKFNLTNYPSLTNYTHFFLIRNQSIRN